MPMSRFQTLLLREWMQHRRGYLVTMIGVPIALMALTLGNIHLHSDPVDPAFVMLASALSATAVVLLVTWAAALFQLPGLARRDQQDRSIEFWASLPVSHGASIGATLLVHALLIPLLALAIGFACAQVLALSATASVSGAASLADVPFGALVLAELSMFVHAALGVLLATLWLSPILLVLMVACAALKRWGIPAAVIGVVVLTKLLQGLYGIAQPGNTVTALWKHAGRAFYAPDAMHSLQWRHGLHGSGLDSLLQAMPGWAMRDSLRALGELVDPMFVFAMALSALCFWLLVLLRRRAAA